MLEKYLPESLKKFDGIIRFAIVLFASNFFWKAGFVGDDNFDGMSTGVTFWGIDCTYIFNVAIYHIAAVVHGLLTFLGFDVSLYETYIIHSNNNSVVVVWGCSGLKQSFIFLCIMLFSRGPFVHKLWYSLCGLIIVYLVNISRIFFLTILVENYQEYFDFVHDYIFKYLFYFIIFMIWVLWEEVLVSRLSPKVEKEEIED